MSNYKFSDYWAVTMFSFTNELLEARKTPLGLIEEVLKAGVTKNIEIDGPMHFRNYPSPDSSEVADLKALLSRHDARISLVGGAADRAISSDRLVESASVVASVKHQLALAGELGAFGLRMMVGGLSRNELEELVPVAEKYHVRILFELHGVMSAESPTALECLKLVQDVDSPYVRLMFDSSLFMTELPHGLLQSLQATGVTDISALAEKWKSSSLSEFRSWLMPQVESFSPRFKAFLPTLLSRVGHAKPADFDTYLPYIESVHLKFWELDEDMTSTQKLIEYLKLKNYEGYLTSEWGGHEWYSLSQVAAMEATLNHKDLVERSFNLAH
ncbi:MAG: hypothetical protein RLZZ471_305 [Actinomycetota bacterium]|jgi:hypothetical protein